MFRKLKLFLLLTCGLSQSVLAGDSTANKQEELTWVKKAEIFFGLAGRCAVGGAENAYQFASEHPRVTLVAANIVAGLAFKQFAEHDKGGKLQKATADWVIAHPQAAASGALLLGAAGVAAKRARVEGLGRELQNKMNALERDVASVRLSAASAKTSAIQIATGLEDARLKTQKLKVDVGELQVQQRRTAEGVKSVSGAINQLQCSVKSLHQRASGTKTLMGFLHNRQKRNSKCIEEESVRIDGLVEQGDELRSKASQLSSDLEQFRISMLETHKQHRALMTMLMGISSATPEATGGTFGERGQDL